MPYQKPKDNHPWKRGFVRESVEKTDNPKVKKVKFLIKEIAESWETMEVVTYSYGREGRYKLDELSQSKQAAWLVNLLKRGYEQI